MAKIVKQNKLVAGIPTASMSDISFLLLLFFMVSTVFVKEQGLDVTMPKAEAIEKIQRKHSATIYVDRNGTVSIDDYKCSIPDVMVKMYQKKAADFNLISCFRTDEKTNYGVMADVMNQLREADALRVSFEAKLKR